MLTKQQGYILCALCYGPAHGYAVAKRTLSLGDENFQLTPSQVYQTLRKLAARGLVQAEGQRYAITTGGLGALAEVMRDNEHFIQTCKNALQHSLNVAQ